MGEWLKPAVLKAIFSRSRKRKKTLYNLLPANSLQRFSISPDFPQFH